MLHLHFCSVHFLVNVTVIVSLAIRCFLYVVVHLPTHCKEAANPTLLSYYHFHNQHLQSYTVTGEAPRHVGRVSLTEHTSGCGHFYTIPPIAVLKSQLLHRTSPVLKKICLKKLQNLQISHQQLLCSRVLKAVTLTVGVKLPSKQGINECDRSHCRAVPPTQGPISN